jgi:8-oxo-dGTP pyrophosphatase MutT (NUDIX family)
MADVRWGPSVTVAAIVEHAGRFLIVEEHTPEGLRLNNPAGHLDPGETLIEAVVRETREETARRFEPEALVGVYLARFQRQVRGEDLAYLRFAFSGRVGEADPALALDREIVRTLWLTPQELRARAKRHRSELVMRCIDDHLAGARYPLALLHGDAAALRHAVRRLA